MIIKTKITYEKFIDRDLITGIMLTEPILGNEVNSEIEDGEGVIYVKYEELKEQLKKEQELVGSIVEEEIEEVAEMRGKDIFGDNAKEPDADYLVLKCKSGNTYFLKVPNNILGYKQSNLMKFERMYGEPKKGTKFKVEVMDIGRRRIVL